MWTFLILHCLGAAALQAANSLDVNAGCASEGSFGLEAIHDGTTNTTFVEDGTPASETLYRMSFDFNTDTLNVPHAGKFFIAVALQEGAGLRPAQLIVSFNNVNGWRAWCQFAQNNGAIGKTPLGDKVTVNSGITQQLMLEWRQSQGGGIDDGICRLTNVTTSESTEVTDIRNSVYSIGRARIGITGRAAIPTGGSLCFDDFQSFRTLAP
jgi:hypothetical protein